MKIDRLLAIIMTLLNRKQANAKELAEYFEVSQKTIYRDIDAINQAGIPIVSYMGSDGGFSIMENHVMVSGTELKNLFHCTLQLSSFVRSLAPYSISQYLLTIFS